MDHLVDKIIETITAAGLVQVEVSISHVRLTRADIGILFGEGHTFHAKRPLSQRGEYLCEEQVTLIGPKGTKEQVAVLAPVYKETQVELSPQGAKELGVTSAQLDNKKRALAGLIAIEGPCGKLTYTSAVKMIENHIKMPPQVAGQLQLKDQQRVSIGLITSNPSTLRDVVIRIDKQYRLRMYMDQDTARTAAISGFTLGQIIPRIDHSNR